MKKMKEPMWAEVNFPPDDYKFTAEELECIIAGDMFTQRQDRIMARELLALRRAEAPAITPDSAPGFILDLMAQIKAAKSPEEVSAIKANVRFADLDVAVDTFDKAIEKLSNL